MAVNREYKATLFSELLQKSETLRGYTSFVDYVRKGQSKGLHLQDAIKDAISWGISQNILGKFLIEHGSEVNSMIQGTKFNINIAKEVWQEEAREDALEEIQAVLAEKDAEIADKDAEIAKLEALVAQLQS